MSVVNVHYAKTHLSRLLPQVEADEEVVIARSGQPVARLVAHKRRGDRRLDTLKGRISISGSFLDPLPEDKLSAWEG